MTNKPVNTHPSPEPSEAQTQIPPTLTAVLWDTLSQMRFVVTLMIIFLAATLLGTFIPQNSDADELIQAYPWAKGAAPTMARFIMDLGLNNLYMSTWYRVLIGLVCLSTTVCAWRRLKLTFRRHFHFRTQTTPDQVARMASSAEVTSKTPPEETLRITAEELKRAGYRTSTVSEGSGASIYSDRGRSGSWGLFALHLAIFLIVVGAVVDWKFGFSRNRIIIPEGEHTNQCIWWDYSQTSPMQIEGGPALDSLGYPKMIPSQRTRELPFYVHLDDFNIESENHQATSYESTVRVLEGPPGAGHDGDTPAHDQLKEVRKFKISMNRPLRYGGLNFYQSDFGVESLTLKITDSEGNVRRVKWAVSTQDMPEGRLYRITPNMGADAVIERPDGARWLVWLDHFLAPDFAEEYVALPRIPTMSPVLPINPAAMVMVHEDMEELMSGEDGLLGFRRVGWVREGNPVTYEDLTIELESVQTYTLLTVTRSPARWLIFLGFTVLTVGATFAFYVPFRIVRVSIAPREDGSLVTMGGTVHGGRSDFRSLFERVSSKLKG